MITWKHVEPDVSPREIGSLIASLPLPDALAIAQLLSVRPLICFSKEARETIRLHVSGRSEESGGLLLGIAAVPGGHAYSFQFPFVCIVEAVPSQDYHGTAVSLHMDPSVWTSAMPKQQAGLMVVGWFHSHPNLGAFFSGTDRNTQRNFFSHEYSVGYVVDPVRDDHAFFVGAESTELDATHVVSVQSSAGLVASLQ